MKPLNPAQKRLLSISQAAALLGITPVTLRYIEKKGLITSQRTLGGIRKYRTTDLKTFLKLHPEIVFKSTTPKSAMITKVSDHFFISQKIIIISSLILFIAGSLSGIGGYKLFTTVKEPQALYTSQTLPNPQVVVYNPTFVVNKQPAQLQTGSQDQTLAIQKINLTDQEKLVSNLPGIPASSLLPTIQPAPCIYLK